MSDSVRPHRPQPTRLPHPWDSPGKNTGVGCHFLLQCMKVKSESEVAQSCLTLCDPMDCSLPGSSVHGIFQARVLEWGAIAFSFLCLGTQKYKNPSLKTATLGAWNKYQHRHRAMMDKAEQISSTFNTGTSGVFSSKMKQRNTNSLMSMS